MTDEEHQLPGVRRRLRDQRGAALVEFAISCSLFLGLIYGAVSYGVVFWVKSSITHAATEGARSSIGSVLSCPTPPGACVSAQARAQSFAQGIVNNLLPSGYAGHANVTASPPTNCPNASTLTCITVTVTYPYKNFPIVPALPPVFPVLPNTLTSTATVMLTN